MTRLEAFSVTLRLIDEITKPKRTMGADALLVTVRKTIGSCHVSEHELEQLVDVVRGSLGSPLKEMWLHRHTISTRLPKKQADGSRKAAPGRLHRVEVDRQVSADSWRGLLEKVRSKQKDRRLRHLLAEFSSGEDVLHIQIGNEYSMFSRAGHRVEVRAIGNEERLAPVVSDMLTVLAGPNDRAARWTAVKWALLLFCVVLPIGLIAEYFTRRFQSSGAQTGDVIGQFVGSLFALAILGSFPFLALAAWLSDRSAASIVLSRINSEKPERAWHRRYESWMKSLAYGPLARPFLREPTRGAALLAFLAIGLTLILGILSLVISVLALAK